MDGHAFHLFDDETRGLTFVKTRRPAFRDALERIGQLRLFDDVTGAVRLAVFRELSERPGVTLPRRPHGYERTLHVVRHHDPVPCKYDRRCDESAPGELPVLLPRQVEAGDGSGDAHGAAARVVEVPTVFAVLGEHLRGGCRGGFLAEVVGDRIAVRGPEHHEAADVPRTRKRYRKREPGGDRGVDRVASVLENAEPRLRREHLLGCDHAVPAPDGLGSRVEMRRRER